MKLVEEIDFSSNKVKALWDYTVSKGIHTDLGQQYNYVFLWWQHFKSNIINKRLVLLLDYSKDTPSVWPLMLRKQYLLNGIHVIGQIDGMITDYAFPIISDIDHFEESIYNTVLCINKNRVKWNYLKINIPFWTGYLQDLNKNTANAYINKLIWASKKYDDYTYIDLEENFIDYLQCLGSRTRSDIKKYLKIFESNDFSFKVIEGDELLISLPELIRLNNSVWSIFQGENNLNSRFLGNLLKKESEIKNGKIIMPILLYNGKIIASVLGYLNNRRCYLHSAGNLRTKVKSLSPGITLYILLIQHLYETNIKVLDLSPGVEEYKLRLNAKVKTITQLVIFKNRISQIIYLSGRAFAYTIRTISLYLKMILQRKLW